MEAMSRGGYFAACRVKLHCKSTCLCPSRKLQQPCLPWQRKRRRTKRESKHDQIVLRQEDEKLFSSVIQSTVVNVKTTHLQIRFCSPLSFHKYDPRGLARQIGNFEIDACSGHSQTCGGAQVVSGDLASIKKIQPQQSLRSCRTPQRPTISGKLSEDTGERESITAERSATCQDAQHVLNSRRQNCCRQKTRSSLAH